MDKVQKIRQEVENLKSQLLRGACSSQIAMETRCKEEAYNEVLSILDTMQKEPNDVVDKYLYGKEPELVDEDDLPTKKDYRERYKRIAKSESFKKAHEGMSIGEVIPVEWEEPVSEDKMTISKEWFEHCKKSWYNEGYIDGEYNRDRQFEETVSEDLGEYINELSKQFPEVSFAKLSRIAVRVTKWQKEQMMVKAIDVEVKVDAGGYPYIPQMELYDYDKDIPLAKEGDKYKVVLIKDE